jgi:transcriptional regulator with XRE-family HTH domain
VDEKNDCFEFRTAIRRELDRRDWTMHRLVKESEVGRATVYDYLNGDREIQTGSLERICQTLNLKLCRNERH